MAMQITSDKNIAGFDYITLKINDLRVHTEEDAKTGKKAVANIAVHDEKMAPTSRFWISLFARYGFNSSFFRYFDHDEVFNRISSKEANDRIRVCVERHEDGTAILQGVSNPDKAMVSYDELVDLLERNKAESVSYCNGMIQSIHAPRVGSSSFEISGDKFTNRFLMNTSIDGYGAPNIYLSMLREACHNNVIGYSKTFKSSLALGKGQDDVGPTLLRALDGFSSDEGYAAIRSRLESASKSWASVYETLVLYKLLSKLVHKKTLIPLANTAVPKAKFLQKMLSRDASISQVESEEIQGSNILKAFHAMTGDASRLYGLANLDAMTAKRQRTLPVKCTVYDVVNFATEVATHYATPIAARDLDGMVGDLLAGEFDMEGTQDRFSDFKDFLIESKVSSKLTTSVDD